MDATTTLYSPKVNQTLEKEFYNDVVEYLEYLKIKHKFRDIISTLAIEEKAKVITGLIKKQDSHAFGKGKFFTAAFNNYKLNDLDPTLHNCLMANPITLQSVCDEFKSDRKIMKIAIRAIITMHLCRQDDNQPITDSTDELIGSLSPKDESPIDFAHVLDVLKNNAPADSEASSPHKTETTPKKPNISPRSLRRRLSKFIPKQRPKEKVQENKEEAKSVTFADRNRSNSSPSIPHITKKSHLEDNNSQNQSLKAIGEVLEGNELTLAQLDNGGFKVIKGPITIETIKLILGEFESHPHDMQDTRNKYAYFWQLKTMLKNQHANLIFDKYHDLFQRYLKIYLNSMVVDWSLDKERFTALIEQYRNLLTIFIMPKPFYFKHGDKEIDVWTVVNENNVQAMVKTGETLSNPFQAAYDIINESKKSLYFDTHQHFTPSDHMKIINPKIGHLNQYLLLLNESICAFCDRILQNEDLKSFFSSINAKNVTKRERLKLYLFKPLINFKNILDALEI